MAKFPLNEIVPSKQRLQIFSCKRVTGSRKMTRHIVSIEGKPTRRRHLAAKTGYHHPSSAYTTFFVDVTVGALSTLRVVYWLLQKGRNNKTGIVNRESKQKNDTTSSLTSFMMSVCVKDSVRSRRSFCIERLRTLYWYVWRNTLAVVVEQLVNLKTIFMTIYLLYIKVLKYASSSYLKLCNRTSTFINKT